MEVSGGLVGWPIFHGCSQQGPYDLSVLMMVIVLKVRGLQRLRRPDCEEGLKPPTSELQYFKYDNSLVVWFTFFFTAVLGMAGWWTTIFHRGGSTAVGLKPPRKGSWNVIFRVGKPVNSLVSSGLGTKWGSNHSNTPNGVLSEWYGGYRMKVHAARCI